MGAIHITFSQAHRTFKHPYSIYTISQVKFIAQLTIQADTYTEQSLAILGICSIQSIFTF